MNADRKQLHSQDQMVEELEKKLDQRSAQIVLTEPVSFDWRVGSGTVSLDPRQFYELGETLVVENQVCGPNPVPVASLISSGRDHQYHMEENNQGEANQDLKTNVLEEDLRWYGMKWKQRQLLLEKESKIQVDRNVSNTGKANELSCTSSSVTTRSSYSMQYTPEEVTLNRKLKKKFKEFSKDTRVIGILAAIKWMTLAQTISKTNSLQNMDICIWKVKKANRQLLNYREYLNFIQLVAPAFAVDHGMTEQEARLAIKRRLLVANKSNALKRNESSIPDWLERLTDHHHYTGSSRSRFDAVTGKGLGISQREPITAGYNNSRYKVFDGLTAWRG